MADIISKIAKTVKSKTANIKSNNSILANIHNIIVVCFFLLFFSTCSSVNWYSAGSIYKSRSSIKLKLTFLFFLLNLKLK